MAAPVQTSTQRTVLVEGVVAVGKTLTTLLARQVPGATAAFTVAAEVVAVVFVALVHQHSLSELGGLG